MSAQRQAATAVPAGQSGAWQTADGPGGERPAVIHTEQLTKVYPGADFAAVDKLDLDVRSGEISGCSGRTEQERPPQRGC